jgi:hypothetical protein
MLNAVDLEEHFVQMPFITGPSTTPPQPGGILLAEFLAPPPDRFVADQYSACGHRLFHVPEAHPKTKVEPNTIRNDLFREPMTKVRVARHSFSIPSANGSLNLTMPMGSLSAARLATNKESAVPMKRVFESVAFTSPSLSTFKEAAPLSASDKAPCVRN